jgi:hypothetical protein
MDPVTIIVAALLAGAAEAGHSVVADAVKSSYERFKSMLGAHFAGTPHAAALDGVEQAPDEHRDAVATAVAATGAASDPAVVAAARSLLAQVDPEGTAVKRFSLQVGGDVQGLVQGDNASVTMTFGQPKPGEE